MAVALDIAPRPLARLNIMAIADIDLNMPALSVLEFHQGVFARVEVPIFPAIVTQDFLSSDGEFLTSGGEGLSW